MNDEAYEQLKARLQELIAKWHATLGLKDWQVDYVYCRDGLPRDDGPQSDTARTVLARARVSWQYLDAGISFDMPRLAEVAPEKLEWIFVHECMHVVVNEMRWQDADNDNLDHEERVATLLARSFIWAYNQGFRDGKEFAASAC